MKKKLQKCLNKNLKNRTKNLNKNLFGPNLCQAKSGVISFLVMRGWGEGFGLGSKNQNCSEWPETHFGFGIFEIQ